MIANGGTVPPGLDETRIPAGRFARTIHVGSYDKLSETWRYLQSEWLARSGHKKRSGASLEIYRNAPGEVPDKKLITELYIAIA